MSTGGADRADERQRSPGLLILLIQSLPLKNNHPSRIFTLTTTQTGKPSLNNIIVHLIPTVIPDKGVKKKNPD